MNPLKKYFFCIFNLSPLFSVSNDELFGSFSPDYDKRYSFLQLSIGLNKIYVISIKNKKFEIIKILRLHQLRPLPLAMDIERKSMAYEELIKAKSNDEINVQLQFLGKRIELENNIKTSFQDKMSVYSAVFLGLLGYVLYLINEFTAMQAKAFIYWLLFFFLLVNIINCIAFIYFFSKNKEVARSKFQDIKNNSTIYKLAGSYYFDWFNIKEERELLSNYIKNLERYLINSSMLVIVLSILFFTGSKNGLNKAINEKNIQFSAISLLDNAGNLNERKLPELLHLFHGMNVKEIKEVYIITSANVKDCVLCERIINAISLFSSGTRIIELKTEDISQNQMIIVKSKQ